MDQEHDDYADEPTLPLPSLRTFLITLLIMAIAAATWFYYAVLLPAQAC